MVRVHAWPQWRASRAVRSGLREAAERRAGAGTRASGCAGSWARRAAARSRSPRRRRPTNTGTATEWAPAAGVGAARAEPAVAQSRHSNDSSTGHNRYGVGQFRPRVQEASDEHQKLGAMVLRRSAHATRQMAMAISEIKTYICGVY